MHTNSCHHCGLNNQAEAQTCRRCGGRLLSADEAGARRERAAIYAKPALTACRACGQIVARSVSSCPHCGKSLRRSKVVTTALMLAVLGILGASLFYGC